MAFLRRYLVCLACCWLAVQSAGVVAAPVYLWQLPVAHGDEECNCPLEPGAACPMHHTKGHDNICKMRNAFGTSEQSLFSLAGGNSVPPSSTVQVMAFVPGASIGLPTALVITTPSVPDAPPPRL